MAQDFTEALAWYRKAAAKGHSSGLCDVGYCYRNGYGVNQDSAKSIPDSRRAAAQGCPTGAYWLGFAYEHGEGVERDLQKAREWFCVSADRGDPDARETLSRLPE